MEGPAEESDFRVPAIAAACSVVASIFLLWRSFQLTRIRPHSDTEADISSPLLPDSDRQFRQRSSSATVLWLAVSISLAQIIGQLYIVFSFTHAQSSAQLTQFVTLTLAWGAALLLSLLEHRRGLAFPGPILPWWWALAAGISFVSAWQVPHDRATWRPELATHLLSGALALVLITAHAITTAYSAFAKSSPHTPLVNAYDRAGPLSRLTFWYILPLLKLGYKRPLQPVDVPPLPKTDDPEPPTCRFQLEWAKERAKSKPSLLRALFRVYGGRVALQAIPCFIAEVGSLACPLLLQRVLTYLTQDTGQSGAATWRAAEYALAFFLFTMMRSAGTHAMWMQLMQVSIQCKYTLIAALYGKVLRMPPAVKGKHAGGKVQNLVASDVDAITGSVLPYVQWWTVSMVMNTILPGFFLYRLVGPAYLIGISVIVALLPASVWVAGIVKRVTKTMYEARDARVKLLGEVVRAILVVKCLAWDDLMLTWITEKRAAELAQRLRLVWWELSEVLLWDTVPAAVPLVTFAWYCLVMRQQLTITTAFTTIAWLDILQMNVNYIPWIYRALINASVSYHRIQDFLLGPELQPLASLPPGTDSAFEIAHADFGWVSEGGRKHRRGKPPGGNNDSLADSAVGPVGANRPVLEDVTLTAKRGEFVAIVGPVGSGKSTLLSAICNGGAVCTRGSVAVTGGCLALVGEEPWVQNASLKDNVTFGAPYEEKRFADVIDACQLAADVAALGPAGADSAVGERGATLSGGQRARCALARACYRRPESELYVLDDCLRGLDVHVSQAVFEKCLLGYLADKTRVVATHDEKLVRAADRIVLLEGGRCREVTVEEWEERARGEEWQGSEGGGQSEGSENEDEGGSEDGEDGEGDDEADGEEEQDDTWQDEGEDQSSSWRQSSSELCVSPRTAALLAGRASREEAAREAEREAIREDKAQVDLRTPLLGTGGGAGPSKPPPRPSPPETGKRPPISRPPVLKKRPSGPKTAPPGQETKREGAVSFSVFAAFFRAAGGWKIVAPAILIFAARIAAGIGRTLWLAVWTGGAEPEPGTAPHSQLFYIQVYAGIVGALSVFAALRSLLADFGCYFAARELHAAMLRAVLRAPMALFHRTSAGTIINRFASDTGQMDDAVPEELSGFIEVALQLVGAIFVVSFSTPVFLLLLLFISLGFAAIAQLYRHAARDLKRIQSLRQSPVYAHFAESMEGAPAVRAFGEVSRFIADGKARVAGFLAAMFSAWAANQFVTFWMDVMGAAVMLGASFLAIVETERGNLRPEMAALSITYAAEFAELLMWSVRQWTELEVAMVAVERVLDYTALPSEAWDGRRGIHLPAQRQSPVNGVPGTRPVVLGAQSPATWPEHGRLEFEDVWLVYEARSRGVVKATGGQKPPGGMKDGDGEKSAAQGGKAALRGVTFAASPGERIAVVGRTGAGKSSLVSALFRLVELDQGRILIDGVDIGGMPLGRLRRGLAVVPQEPVLFSGSLRSNLDPRGTRTDREIWDALEAVALKETVAGKEKKLEEQVGGALSLGERQLLCVARALLQSAKVTVLDEASSALDAESERAIYRALLWRPGMPRSLSRGASGSSGQLSRPPSGQALANLGGEESGRGTPRAPEGAPVGGFYPGTVLYIAHKLSTVLQCDRVIVLDQGRIVEMDSPEVLLAREGSRFAAMVETVS